MQFAHQNAREPKPGPVEPDASVSAVPGGALLAHGYDFTRIPLHAEREADRVADEASAQAGASSVREVMQARSGIDLSTVRVHTGTAAANVAEAAGARAYTLGRDIVFGAGQFNPGTAEGNRLYAHELAHVVQQANGLAPAIQRKEVETAAEVKGPRDWTTADRENDTERWQQACLTNLNNADSSQYTRIVERRDFYQWFFNYTGRLGYHTRWALAAYIVANGAHQIADMDTAHDWANGTLSLANVELQGMMRQGNQVIFDNVLPKLKQLLDGGALTNDAALRWDMQTLSEEQNLVQPIYNAMSPETLQQLDYIAHKRRFTWLGALITGEDKVAAGVFNEEGTVPAYDQPDIRRPENRWRYGMDLGNTFRVTGNRFDKLRNPMPQAATGYRDGSEFAKVNTHPHLHQLDAFLNPHRFERTGPGADLVTIVNSLTPAEKRVVLADRSADGWRYSTAFARFGFIAEQVVAMALPVPDGPEDSAAAAAFLDRYRAERAHAEMANQALVRQVAP